MTNRQVGIGVDLQVPAFEEVVIEASCPSVCTTFHIVGDRAPLYCIHQASWLVRF